MKILVIGSLNMDLVISSERMPKLGETLQGNGFSVIPGGKGANQAIAAARLLCDVSFCGAVGDDLYGETLRSNLARNGVSPVGLETVEGSSGVAMITVVGGDNFIILEKGANGKVDAAMVERHRALIEESDILVLQFEIPMEAVLVAAKIAHEAGKTVLVNPAPVTEVPGELYSYTDIFIPNHHEAGILLGRTITDIRGGMEALDEFRVRGVKNPIITMGKDGAVFFDGNENRHMPAYHVKAVDSTGAGDSFIGGLCAAFSNGKSLTDAVAYATAVSAVTVMSFGASPSFPTPGAIRERLGVFSELPGIES